MMNLRSAKLRLVTPLVPETPVPVLKSLQKLKKLLYQLKIYRFKQQTKTVLEVRLVLEQKCFVTETLAANEHAAVAPAIYEPAEQVAVTQTIAARNPTRRKLTLRSAASHIEPVQEQPAKCLNPMYIFPASLLPTLPQVNIFFNNNNISFLFSNNNIFLN